MPEPTSASILQPQTPRYTSLPSLSRNLFTSSKRLISNILVLCSSSDIATILFMRFHEANLVFM